MLAAPFIADSPDTQQSASSDISHDLSHSSWKEVGHAVWSKDGEKKRSSSASLKLCLPTLNVNVLSSFSKLFVGSFEDMGYLLFRHTGSPFQFLDARDIALVVTFI